MDFTSNLIKTIADTRYEDIPTEAVTAAKRIVLDTLGAALAGTTAPICKMVLNQVREWGGRRQSTVIGYGYKVPSPNAALANSMLARTREIDDIYERNPTHSSGIIVPASLATAEQKGRVNGREFITAIVLGIDLHCRISHASKTSPARRKWDASAAGGAIGSAVAAARILGLDKERLQNSVAIAYSQAGGSDQGVTQGLEAMTWALQHALASKAGVVSALLAQRGFSGANDPLTRYLHVFESDEYDPSMLIAEYGKKFEVVDISVKPYPCSRTHHGSIHAALTIVKECDIKPEEIEEVSVLVNEMTYRTSCEPLEIKQNPERGYDAQFSLPYSVANAIVRRRALLEDYTDEALQDSLVLEIAKKVKPKINPDIKTAVGRPAVVMEIKTRDGKIHVKREEYVFGHPKNPLSIQERQEKFSYCASRSLKPLPERTIAELLQVVDKLEDLSDITEIIKLVSASSSGSGKKL